MRRVIIILLFLLVSVFIASGLGFALLSDGQFPIAAPLPSEIGNPFISNDYSLQATNGAASPSVSFSDPFLRPQTPLGWGFLIAVWLAACFYALRILRAALPAEPKQREAAPEPLRGAEPPAERVAEIAATRTPDPTLTHPATAPTTAPPVMIVTIPPSTAHAASPAPSDEVDLLREQLFPADEDDNLPPLPDPVPVLPPRLAPLNEIVTMGLGLLTAAIWPWVFLDHPVMGFLLAALMLALMLGAALSRGCFGPGYRTSAALGVVAGWATIVCCAAFATLLERSIGTSAPLSILVALLICSIASAYVQIHLGSPLGFSLAVIWGLLVLAVTTMSSDATVATAAVLAIAFVSVSLVRVAS